MYAIIQTKTGRIGFVSNSASALAIVKRIYRRSKIAFKTVKVVD